MLPLAARYTINLDKIELMLIQSEIENSIFENLTITHFPSLTPSTAANYYSANGIILEKIYCTDTNYHLAYNVLIDKQSFGTLLLNRTKFYETDCDLIKLKINNAVLYTKFVPVLMQFLASFHFSINNITRLDIALDTNTDLLENFYHYFRNENDFFLKGGNKKLASIDKYSKEYRNGSETPTLRLGKADKLLRIYNKSLEIVEKSQKYYITDFHKANGLDIETDVYRLEISLSNTALKRYVSTYRNPITNEVLTQHQYDKIYYNNSKQNFNYVKETVLSELIITPDQYTDTTALASIFKTVLGTVMQFKQRDNANVSRCTDVDLIDFSSVPKVVYNAKFITTILKRDKNQMKNVIKTMVKQYRQTETQSFLTAAFDMATAQNLLDYYQLQLKSFGINENALYKQIEIPKRNFIGLFDTSKG